MGALTFNAVNVSLSTDVGTVCDLIQFCKKHLWLFQVQQETMSYHTHHVHHGKSLIKSLQRKRGSVCMCVSRNICLKQKSLWIYCLASWKAQLSLSLSYLGSLKPEGKSISIRDYTVPFLLWDGTWAKVTDIQKLSINELFLSGATDVWFAEEYLISRSTPSETTWVTISLHLITKHILFWIVQLGLLCFQ